MAMDAYILRWNNRDNRPFTDNCSLRIIYRIICRDDENIRKQSIKRYRKSLYKYYPRDTDAASIVLMVIWTTNDWNYIFRHRFSRWHIWLKRIYYSRRCIRD